MSFLRTVFQKVSLDRLLSAAIVTTIIWYVGLCVVNYLSLRPLWNDEECVFISIKGFNAKQIFSQPLAAVQVFPRLYLFFIQQVARPFDFHLLSLRVLPFICMLLGFFIWLKIAAIEFKSKLEYLTFVLSWPASAVLIYYSGELKQYSMDVLAASVFILFLYHEEKLRLHKPKQYFLILIALPLFGFFSYPSFLFSLVVLYNLILISWRKKNARFYFFSYGISLALCLILSFIFDIRFRHVETVTTGFADYFVSFNSAGEFFKTFGEGTMNLFSRWFVERPKILKQIGVGFVVIGMIYMLYAFFASIRREKFNLKSLSVLAFAIYMGLFILGCLHKYMFTIPRTSLFYCPIVLWLTVKGIASLKKIFFPAYTIIHGAYIIFLIFIAAHLTKITFSGQLTFRPVLW